MQRYLRYAVDRTGELTALIREMVECESPSDSPDDVNRFVDLMIERTRDIAHAQTIASDRYGRHLRLEFRFPGKPDGKQMLVIGHSDTVWPLGTLREMPFREEDGRLWGPGVLDMKSGIAFCIYAARALQEADVSVPRKVTLLLVSDEEVGSRSSRELTEAEAKQSECVLVLEPGSGLEGKLKTARKGVGNYHIAIEGKAAHAGVDFGDGASAIVEAARQIVHIASFTDLERGTTVNPGIVSGGTRPNVIAARADVTVDVRVVRSRDGDELDRKFGSLRPFDARCKIQVEGGLNRPPMERSEGIARLFTRAKGLAAELGLQVEESATGGGSDGNFTAAIGVPTLDGLGGVGEGAHAANESILTSRIADRVALLAGLMAGA